MPLLEQTRIEGVLGLLGLGWLGASAALSGSPVAAIALTLLDAGAVDTREALAMVSGSRFGASFIVLVVGFISYVRGRRRADGIYVGVVTLITTVTVYAPATAIGLFLVDSRWIGRLAEGVPAPPGQGIQLTAGALPGSLAGHLPDGLVFAVGGALLLAAFWLFDRALPRFDPPPLRFEALVRRLRSRGPAFCVGALVTALTMSVAVSVTMLVPLTLKGIVRREQLIPFIMGANITTFVDTFVASLLLDSPAAPAVVLAQVIPVSVVSLFLLGAIYGPYAAAVHGLAHRLLARRSTLVLGLLAWGAVPAFLVVV